MALGMTFLVIQLALQLVAHLPGDERR